MNRNRGQEEGIQIPDQSIGTTNYGHESHHQTVYIFWNILSTNQFFNIKKNILEIFKLSKGLNFPPDVSSAR